MQAFFYCILFISISANFAALLDGACNDNDRCQGENLVCQNGKCRCDTPLYRPCNSSCELNPRVSYEGDRCVTNEHCLDNMRCFEQKCVCLQDYQSRSQLCYKTLNKTCNNGTECWSGYCINAQCTCPVGYVANDDGVGCRRKLVKIYRTLQEARPTEAFCSDSSSCYDPIAECHNESNTASIKFCKCPQGFRVSDDNEKCELVESPHFSPLTEVPTRYEECGTCKDANAICMLAAQERTCWCRAGYRNENGRCVNDRFRPIVIFPNEEDRSKYDYTASCQTVHNVTGTIAERLCTCSPGYRFVAKDRICRKIELEWNNDALEYGLCTHIDSAGSTTPDAGLCPLPLTCQARRDKYVCSCGSKRFRDIDDPSKCVYYIGEKTENPTDLCPTKNAQRNSTTGVCQCLVGYKETTNRRQCTLELSRNVFDNVTCSNSRSNDNVCVQYGVGARLCLPGECRCDGIGSFAGVGQQKCYAPLNVTLTRPFAECPPQSTLQGSVCRCATGYFAADRITCAPLRVQLVEYIGSPPSGAAGSLRNEDCRVLFSGPVQLYNASRCQCSSNAFVRPDETGCWYKLNVSLSGFVNNSECPPHSVRGLTDYCKCEPGYQQNQNECVMKKVELYEYDSTTAVNTTDLIDADCTKLFGDTTQIYPGRFYCVCKSGAFLTRSKLGCIYRIGYNDTVTKTIPRCPEHAYIKQDGNYYTCLCQEGFYPSNNKEACETSPIALVGARNRNSTIQSNCVQYKDADCQVKFGLDAYCQNDTCYCNRRTSYINIDGRCEPVSSYVFPGLHEYQSHTCMVDKDCGDQENVVCAKLNSNARHKVCRCADGSFLDPKSNKCMSNRCEPPCNTANNFQCLGDQCVCKTGYILNGNTCVINNYKLELNERCNASVSVAAMIDTAKNDYLMCDARCLRARCITGFRPDEESCVRYTWEDACFNQKDDVCATISTNAFCNPESNRCTCRPSFYQSNEGCARVVNSRCVNDEDCGNNMRCETQRCQCNADQHVDDGEDVYGRPIQLCINNGGEMVKFSLSLILLALIAFLN